MHAEGLHWGGGDAAGGDSVLESLKLRNPAASVYLLLPRRRLVRKLRLGEYAAIYYSPCCPIPENYTSSAHNGD